MVVLIYKEGYSGLLFSLFPQPKVTKMGLNRIVTLFHAKLNTVGDSRRGSARSSSVSSSASSGSEERLQRRHEDFDSSTTMSLSSSVESLSGVVVASTTMAGTGKDVNNNASSVGECSAGRNSCLSKLDTVPYSVQTVHSSFNNGSQSNGSFEDVLLVLGTEGAKSSTSGGAVAEPCVKRNIALSRRFSLKAKFSSDMDLYGKMTVDGEKSLSHPLGTSTTSLVQRRISNSSSTSTKKSSSIWSSFRLPIRLAKGKVW